MNIIPVTQGSPEWLQARLGIPTASCFEKIVTATGKPSTQADTYLYQLLAEWLTGKPHESFTNEWMDRGTALEPEARAYFEMTEDCEVQQVGFCTTDDGLMGCSPDMLIGTDGGGEIKCPSGGVHVQYLMENAIPSKYIPQVQGSMYVTGRKWWKWLSYHPDMPPVIVRVERDAAWHKSFDGIMRGFLAKMAGLRRELIEKGHTPKLAEAA